MIAGLHTRQQSRRKIPYVLGALIALAALPVAAPVMAQAPAAAHKPSPDAILLAKQIIEIKGAKKTMFDPLVRGVIEKVKNQFMQTNFMFGNDLNEVAANLEKEYAGKSNEMVDEAARIYASHFTEAELKQILTFYQSPLGRKVIVEEPRTLDESMAAAGRWGDEFSEVVIEKMREEMKKRGHDI